MRKLVRCRREETGGLGLGIDGRKTHVRKTLDKISNDYQTEKGLLTSAVQYLKT